MKKALLFFSVICFNMFLSAQNSRYLNATIANSTFLKSGVKNRTSYIRKTVTSITGIATFSDRDINIVSIIPLGTSANACNTFAAQRSILWVDPALNTVTCFHNMGGALDSTGFVGNLGYDLSVDAGSTFNNMINCYEVSDTLNYTDAARFPNHAVYNPAGNTDPANASVVFFASDSDTANGYGNNGYAYGRSNIGTPSDRTRHQMASHDNYYLNAPTGFELTSQGMVFAVDVNQKARTHEYQGSLIVTKGVWNDTVNDFDYTQSLLVAPVTADLGSPVFTQVAFGPDGNTGYIVMLGDNDSAVQPMGFKGLYPIYWKTTDAGNNWQGPYFVQLDGPDGLTGIVQHLLTNEQILNLFGPPVPDRTEINYTTAFDFDCAVDNYENLHIAVVIGPTGATPYSIIAYKNYIHVTDIFIGEGKNSWYCADMGPLNTFRGTYGDTTCDNRTQISTTADHKKLFISWLDSDYPDNNNNNQPNIFCRGVDPALWMKTMNTAGENAPNNVTLFSQGMWSAHFFTAPEYCFSNSNNNSYTIPFVYEDIDTADLSQPVQFEYIQDFSFEDYDFQFPLLTQFQGLEENRLSGSLTVSQNHPNPVKTSTDIQIVLKTETTVSLAVYSITGQKVFFKDFGKFLRGSHHLKFDRKGVSPGIFYYVVHAGNATVTKKMIIK